MNPTSAEQTWMNTHHRPDWQRRLASAQRRGTPRRKTMSINEDLKIEVGDEFRDVDYRMDPRIVKIIAVHNIDGVPQEALVETMVPPTASPKSTGRHSTISVRRLRDLRLFQKVSR